MSLKALTANTAPEENAHILAEDDAAIFQSMFGDDGVLEIGQQMKATVISNNKVRVADGVVCIGGHVARTVYGDYTDLTIENGESGKNRNDLIIGTFSTTGAGGIDTMQLAVKKGTAGTAATDPALTQGNLYAGSKLREVPLWRVKIEGLSITKVEQLFEIVPSIPTLKKELESLNGKLPVIQAGSKLCKGKANEVVKTYVAFRVPFLRPPIVVVSPASTVPGIIVKGVSAGDITEQGFNIYVMRTNDTDTSVRWVAIV